MRSLVLGATLTAVLVLAAATVAATATPADGPGETHVEATTYMATVAPTPEPETLLLVRNTLDGVPFITFVFSSMAALVEDQKCGTGGLPEGFLAIARLTKWPWSQFSPCNKNGVPIRICDDWFATVCSDEFVVEGDSMVIDLDFRGHEPFPDWPKLRVDFSHDGVAQPVIVKDWYFGNAESTCSSSPLTGSRPKTDVQLSSVITPWPPPCDTAGTRFEAVFDTADFGRLSALFTWSGDQEQTITIDTGRLLATPTPTPEPSASPTPTPTAATLPQTGGRP